METMLQLKIPKLAQPLCYKSSVLLIGSCFTEHISDRLHRHKFKTLSNPNGILFNPLSVASALDGYVSGRIYEESELFLLDELWHCWDHHTRFSDTDRKVALQKINQSQQRAGSFVREANWIIITLGSAFQYYLTEGDRPVANNHRAPGNWFEKKLLQTEAIEAALSASMNRLLKLNPAAQFLFTISPVRHIRDGVIDNNRSKSRLIEAVHRLCESFTQAHYFPAYELVIDILRDYRYYDIDFVHPNYQATEFVWEQFSQSCIDEDSMKIMTQVQELMTASAHKPRFPDTQAHQTFRVRYAEKAQQLMKAYPFLDLQEELKYFLA